MNTAPIHPDYRTPNPVRCDICGAERLNDETLRIHHAIAHGATA